jgi:hypothetical protein
MNIAVPASDLKKINAESIPIPGEPGMYIAGLSVYHELHCLVSSRTNILIKSLLNFTYRSAFANILGATFTFQIRQQMMHGSIVCTQV